MKATGIVRRIDELGRVVIPKEIRRVQHIRSGDSLEIFMEENGEVVFKKYSPLAELGEPAAVYADVLARRLGCGVLVCDREHIVAAAGAPHRFWYTAILRAACCCPAAPGTRCPRPRSSARRPPLRNFWRGGWRSEGQSAVGAGHARPGGWCDCP